MRAKSRKGKKHWSSHFFCFLRFPHEILGLAEVKAQEAQHLRNFVSAQPADSVVFASGFPARPRQPARARLSGCRNGRDSWQRQVVIQQRFGP